MNKFIALVKREILEHRNIWRVPLILVGLSLLVRMSLLIGNLSFDLEVPEQLQLDETIDGAIDQVVAGALSSMNFIVMMAMFVVAIFYALSSLFNERQDDSVLFWRSLPISDSMTIASKMAVALIVVPVMIVLAQALMAIIFFGTDAFAYLSGYYAKSLPTLFKLLLWSMLPTIAWCVFCSSISKKNPFLLAFIAPIALILVDKLFLNGFVSQTFVINRITGVSYDSIMPLLWGVVFSAVFVGLAIIKRSQRI